MLPRPAESESNTLSAKLATTLPNASSAVTVTLVAWPADKLVGDALTTNWLAAPAPTTMLPLEPSIDGVVKSLTVTI